MLANTNQSSRVIDGLHSRQRGVVLVICMLILLVLTLIGLTATRSSTLQLRMSGNQYAQQLAFQAAEASLRDAENYLSQPALDPFDGNNGLYDADPDTPGANPPVNVDWSDASAVRQFAGKLDNYPDATYLPRYYIVHTERTAPITTAPIDPTKPKPPATIYKVVVRATDPNGKTPVMLQSFFQR